MSMLSLSLLLPQFLPADLAYSDVSIWRSVTGTERLPEGRARASRWKKLGFNERKNFRMIRSGAWG